jgi:hypothetical protein
MELLNNQREKGPWAVSLSLALAGSLLFSLISITLPESFLALACLLWLVLLFRKERKPEFPAFSAVVRLCGPVAHRQFSR